MSTIEVLAVITLVVYAIYKQTRVSEVRARGRFTMAIGYAVIGISVGGFSLPHRPVAAGLLAASILLSLAVGLARGHHTRIWREPDGRVYRQGTALTVGLFLTMLAAKFAMGTYAYLAHVPTAGGFGEILIMMAIMLALQAEIVVRRAAALVSSAAAPSRGGGAAARS